MKTYARIDDGAVVEIIEPMTDNDGHEIQIENRFTAVTVSSLAVIPDGYDVQQGWTFVNGVFAAPVPVTPTADQIRASYEAAAQGMIDSFAKTWGYDSLERAAGYRGDPNPKYDAEATALFQWRSAVWTKSEQIDEAVRAGGAPPVDVSAYLAMLPSPPTKPTA
jgi:hypothetical protein